MSCIRLQASHEQLERVDCEAGSETPLVEGTKSKVGTYQNGHVDRGDAFNKAERFNNKNVRLILTYQ